MLEYLISVVGGAGAIWLLGYGCTLRQLNGIPGFPVNKRMLLVSWPLTLLAIKALDTDSIVDDFLEDINDVNDRVNDNED